eukprot:TRINITY_DN776231_c0_g1_i1.p1 TRINITY_DN776231_c0_g1~~TRINITY_DN776231_c0_g1_i1.p1  ORF type:complete len:331 (+),score=48.62 TRINITY_DN776231_c0_g1_i1:115-1107(+)
MLSSKSNARKAINPQRITKFLDPHCRPGTTQRMTMQTTIGFGTTSRSMKPFSKMEDTTEIAKKEFYRSATRMGVLDTLETHGKLIPGVPRKVPKTMHMMDVKTLRKNHSESALLERERYIGSRVDIPMKEVPKPACLGMEDSLLTPADRRELLKYEILKERTDNTRRKTEIAKKRQQTLLRQHFPTGCVGLDAPTNTNSKYYVSEREKQRQLAQQYDNKQNMRKTFLGERNRSMKGPELELVPKRRKVSSGLVNTAERLFEKDPKREPKPERAQFLRNQQTCGRRYNIVTGALVEHVAPTIPEKHHSRLAHPSMVATGFTRPSTNPLQLD